MTTEAKPENARKRRKMGVRLGILALGLGLAGMIGGTAAVIGAYFYASPALPAAETIRDIPLQIPLRILNCSTMRAHGKIVTFL